jgi:hypothetical protein
MKSRIREEEDHSIRGERWNGGAGHVVTESTRVIYGKLHILAYLMSWSERLADARDVATHLPLSVELLACDICWCST